VHFCDLSETGGAGMFGDHRAFSAQSDEVTVDPDDAYLDSFSHLAKIIVGQPGTTFRDAAKTDPIADGEAIRNQTQAQSGLAFGDMTTTSDATAFVYDEDGFNGLPCAQGAMGRFWFHQLASGVEVADCCIFVVCTVNSSASDKAIFYSGETTGYDNNNQQLLIRGGQNSGVDRITVGGNGNWHQPASPIDTPMVIGLRYVTGDQWLRIETASTVYEDNSPSPGPAPPASRSLRTLYMGRRAGTVAWEWWLGKLREMRWIDGAMSEAEFNEFIAALKRKNAIV